MAKDPFGQPHSVERRRDSLVSGVDVVRLPVGEALASADVEDDDPAVPVILVVGPLRRPIRRERKLEARLLFGFLGALALFSLPDLLDDERRKQVPSCRRRGLAAAPDVLGTA